MVDLGAVDLTRPVRYDLMVWDGFDIVPTGQSRCLPQDSNPALPSPR